MKLKWVNSTEAEKIPEGSAVLIRGKIRSRYRYSVCNHFRPDWIRFGEYAFGFNTTTEEYAVIPKE